MMPGFRSFCLMCGVLVSCYAITAQAQIFGAEQTAAPISFGDKNPQVKDLLTLQYQLQILKRLIDHEKAVNKIVTSGIDLGLTEPTVPPPDEALCAKVPANIPCAQAYPELYDDYSAMRKKPEALPVAALPAPSLVAGSDVPSLEAAALTGASAVLPAGQEIFWTDITCLSGTCTAVITPNPGDPKARYRVSKGEKLPDGATITKISVTGVSLQRGNKTVQLDPAPKA